MQQCNPNGPQHTPQERPREVDTERISNLRQTTGPPGGSGGQTERTANSEQQDQNFDLCYFCYLFFSATWGWFGKKIQCHGARQNSVSQESPHNVKVERTRSPSYKLDQVGYQCRDRWGTGGHASESERVETVRNLKLNGLNGSPEHVLTVLGSSGSSNRKCTQHQTQAKHRPRTNCHKFQTKLKDNAAQIRETKGTMPRVQKTSKKTI